MNSIKVLFLLQKKDAPSAKWRILQFIPHFERAGISCTVDEWPAGTMARLAAAKKAGLYDITVLQKRLLPKLLLNRLRHHARKLVFEFDDVLVLKKADGGTVRESPTRDRRFRRIVRAADAVITTNDYLAELARRHTPEPDRVNVFPSVIDLTRWPAAPAEVPSGPATVIGWVGTAPNLASVEVLHPALVRLCRRYHELCVKLVCESPLALEGVRVEHKAYACKDEVEDIRSFHIAVAPLVEDTWTRGKVSMKILAYFAAGLPVVASNVQANRLYVRDGENGFLAGTLAEWEDRLSRLIEDAELRRKIGAAAREGVERDYSITSAAPRYVALFEKLSGKL